MRAGVRLRELVRGDRGPAGSGTGEGAADCGDPRPPRRARYKRGFDLVAVGAGLALLAPLWVVLVAGVALAVRLADGGPVLYRQPRLGRGGAVFEVLKFRTLPAGPEGGRGPTRLGALLRCSRLDELPQVVNVLRGEMSLVGPRPERPALAARIEAAVPGFARRLAVAPGIAGLAQARGGHDLAARAKLRYDLLYIGAMGPWLDVKLVAACVVRVAAEVAGVARDRRCRGGTPRECRSGCPRCGGPGAASKDADDGVTAVVPTYREAENVGPLARGLAAALAGRAWELVLVDDDSGDGIDAVVGALARTLPVRLVVRAGAPRDLSAAVLEGIAAARHDRVVVMDADLSHPPERVPALLARLGGEVDMVVGSRRVAGGRVEGRWGLGRRLNAWTGRMAARPLAGACADPLSGFFAVRRERWPAGLGAVGFKVGLEAMARGRLRVAEVPIAFRACERGASKLGWRQRAQFARQLHGLYLARFGTAARLASFGTVGVTGFLVDVGCYAALQALGVEHRIARFLSFWPAATWNWAWNRSLTFGDRAGRASAGEWLRFAAACAAGLVANVGGYAALTTAVGWFDRHRLAALAAGVALGAAANYAAASGLVYGGGRGPRGTGR